MMFNEKVLDKVSIVLPDFEITKNRIFDKFSTFLNFEIFSSSKLLKK